MFSTADSDSTRKLERKAGNSRQKPDSIAVLQINETPMTIINANKVHRLEMANCYENHWVTRSTVKIEYIVGSGHTSSESNDKNE